VVAVLIAFRITNELTLIFLKTTTCLNAHQIVSFIIGKIEITGLGKIQTLILNKHSVDNEDNYLKSYDNDLMNFHFSVSFLNGCCIECQKEHLQ